MKIRGNGSRPGWVGRDVDQVVDADDPSYTPGQLGGKLLLVVGADFAGQDDPVTIHSDVHIAQRPNIAAIQTQANAKYQVVCRALIAGHRGVPRARYGVESVKAGVSVLDSMLLALHESTSLVVE
jgi:hypothetical protein